MNSVKVGRWGFDSFSHDTAGIDYFWFHDNTMNFFLHFRFWVCLFYIYIFTINTAKHFELNWEIGTQCVLQQVNHELKSWQKYKFNEKESTKRNRRKNTWMRFIQAIQYIRWLFLTTSANWRHSCQQPEICVYPPLKANLCVFSFRENNMRNSSLHSFCPFRICPFILAFANCRCKAAI